MTTFTGRMDKRRYPLRKALGGRCCCCTCVLPVSAGALAYLALVVIPTKVGHYFLARQDNRRYVSFIRSEPPERTRRPHLSEQRATNSSLYGLMTPTTVDRKALCGRHQNTNRLQRDYADT